ncbi:hypothetical protein C8R46DRAFT_993490 [Mycena filopes]|nr:hypothetical protein C8R46DRAFT_993490 [Mycena filopes]
MPPRQATAQVPLDPPPAPDSDLPESGASSWTLSDEKALIEYFIDHLSEAGEGNSFKQPTLNAAAIAMNLIRTEGGPKTARSCQSKYLLLRKFQGFVDVILGISGWKWDPKKGVDVTPATKGTWDAWVAKNPAAARFRNKGWPHYDRLALLMPEKAKGGNVFRASQYVPERSKSLSPDWDYDALDKDCAPPDDDDEDPGRGDIGGAGDVDGDTSQNNDDETDVFAVRCSAFTQILH